MLVRTLLGVVVAACALSASHADRTLCGRVSDGATPVAEAIVTISSQGLVMSATTGIDGGFAIHGVPAGRYDFRVAASGYSLSERVVIVHSYDSHRNWIDVNNLIPADRQTVSVNDLLAHKEARNH